jgi:hypothetical protein
MDKLMCVFSHSEQQQVGLWTYTDDKANLRLLK